MPTKDPLKIRFSRLVHHQLYRYSFPATSFKFLGELALWAAVAYIPIVLIAETMGFSQAVPVFGFNSKGAAWFALASLALSKEYCKTTVPKERC